MLSIPGISSDYFNSATRSIQAKIDIYFDGLSASPVTVLNNDYIVDIHISMESGAESLNPFGKIAANSADITLTNTDRVFSPNNASGPYYGKINLGVPIKIYFRPILDGAPWIPMGLYYVSDWKTVAEDLLVDISCSDTMKDLLSAPLVPIQDTPPITFQELILGQLTAQGYSSITVIGTLTHQVNSIYYASKTVADTLEDMLTGALSILTSDRYGGLKLQQIAPSASVFTMTDTDQIITIETDKSIIQSYDGVKLTYRAPQLVPYSTVLEATQLHCPAGTYEHKRISLSKKVSKVSGVTVNSSVSVQIVDYKTDNLSITPTTSAVSETDAQLTVVGDELTMLEREIFTEGTNLLEVQSGYIQTDSYAQSYLDTLTGIVNQDVPKLNLKVRGNPLIEIGDICTVSSSKYNVSFVGFVRTLTFTYDGALSSSMEIMNAEGF